MSTQVALSRTNSVPNKLKTCRRSRFNNASHQRKQIKLIKCPVEFPRVSSLNSYCWPKIAPFAEMEEIFRKATLILAAVVIWCASQKFRKIELMSTYNVVVTEFFDTCGSAFVLPDNWL